MSASYIQGDTLDPLELTISVDGEAFDFDDEDEVVLRYTKPDGEVIEAELTLIEGLPGGVKLEWADGDLDLVGKYEGQIRLRRDVSETTKQRTFPNNGYPVVWWVKAAI